MRILCLIFAVILLAACETDSYDKGAGKNSLTMGDLMTAHANGDKSIDYITTDNDEKLIVSQPVTAKWITTADSTYRTVAYYNKLGEGKAEIISIGLVPTVIPRDSVKEVVTDPVTFESMWTSKNKKYLNLSIWLKIGNTSVEDAHQTIGMLRTAITTADDGRTTTHLTLLHSQGEVPEKYSTQYFLSIPHDSIPTDSVRLTVETYSGRVEKQVGW